MTVAELIKILQRHPPEARVVTHGYEGGCDDIEQVTAQPLMLDYNRSWYEGTHRRAAEDQAPHTIAVLLATKRINDPGYEDGN